MNKRTFIIGTAILAVITTFMFSFTMINDDASAKEIEKTWKHIGKSASDNDITLTIRDAVKDENGIHLKYVIMSKKNIHSREIPETIFEGTNILINGEKMNAGTSYETKQVGKGEVIGFIHITPENELPDHYDVKFNADSVLKQPGQWPINFSL
ncbi:DUF4179 domain-containing protein [Peribacillus muralis]|uniref:DUF4179 domain-containing protein n=1 Tax=Peribacillus muralis TaxID=264697 RepID=UPI00070BE058|nr:DUF4179 domain-containing protein [Peribacillus muralis]